MSDAERRPAVNPRAELVDVYKLWWAHDAHWYQGVAKRFGQEVANEINAEAMRQVAVQAGRRVAQQLGRVPDGGDPEELRRRLVACADRMFPAELRNASLDVADDDLIVLTVRRNFALAMLRMATSLESYQCPCTAIHAGWFEGLGVPLTENRTAQCQRHGDAVCESLMRFPTPNAEPAPAGAVSAGAAPAGAAPVDTVPVDTVSADVVSAESAAGAVPANVVPAGAAPVDTAAGAVPAGAAPVDTAAGAVPAGAAPVDTAAGAVPAGAAPVDTAAGAVPAEAAPVDTVTSPSRR